MSKPEGQAQRFLREAYPLRYVERKKLQAGPSGVAYRDLEQSDDEIPGSIKGAFYAIQKRIVQL